MRIAQIALGEVINVVAVDPDNIPEFAANWPELTGEASIGWTWDGTTFTAPVVVPDTNLTPNEFEYLLDVSGLDDAWTALAAYLKANDRTAYADLQAERRKSTFRLDYTLAQVATFRPILGATGYDITELTDANITTQWDAIVAARG